MNVLSSTLAIGGGDAAAPSRSSNSADKGGNGGFDAMLQGKPAASPPAASATAGKEPGAADASRQADTSTPPDDENSRPADAAAGTSPADKPAPESDGSAEAPWPPLGLSAMLPAPVETAPAPAPAANAGTATDPRQNAATASAIAALNAPAQPKVGLAPPAAPTETAEAALPLSIAAPGDKLTTVQLDSDVPAPTAFNAVLHSQAAPELRGPASAPTVDAATATPDITSGDFDDAIGARVSWLAEQKIGHAHIRITPHDLGQIEVKLQMEGERVHASFSSAHADVRQALENSLPRLREMLGEQGLQLAHADVGQQQTSQQQGEDRPAGTGQVAGSSDDGAERAATSHQTLRMRGLLDAYA